MTDNKNISSKRVINYDSKEYKTLLDFINKVANIHDPSDIMLVLPNSGRIRLTAPQPILRRK